jgi:hypothetical protein
MRPRVAIYVTDDELKQIRREAARRRVSLSRHLKERLLPGDWESASDGALLGPEDESRLTQVLRRAADAQGRKLLDQISTLIVMVDQLAARTLGESHHQDWQQQVESLVRELRGDAEATPNGRAEV